MARNIEATIAALLAKAEGTTNAAEAEAYMEKAERLMLQHGVERAQLEAHRPGTKREEIVTHRITIKNGHGYAMAMVRIAFNVGPSFSLKVLQSTLSDGGRVAWLIGHKSDVEDATALIESLITQSRTQALSWWRTTGKDEMYWATDNQAYLARREFIYAFASGAGSRLAETRQSVVAEAGAGAELVLVDRSKLVEDWVSNNMQVGTARASSRKSGGMRATVAGHAAGREAVTGKALQN